MERERLDSSWIEAHCAPERVLVFTQTSSSVLSILGGVLVVAGIGAFFGC